jgi:ubiquinone/menaquinone biosynthesis C-methylase UbiE
MMDSRLLANASEEMGEQYERGFVPVLFGPWAAVLVERVPPHPGERVLDVACGTGVVTRLAAERVGPSGTVVGADVSPAMLAAARRASEGMPIDWREADAGALPFADASFDLVFCQQGLQFFPDRPAALREMRRVLAPGGRLGLAVWRRQEENAGFQALGEVLARHIGPQAGELPPFALGDAELVRGLVAEAGFREIEVRRETLPARWPSAEGMLKIVAAGAGPMIAALTALSDEERCALVDDFAAAVAAYTTDEGLVYPLASNLIIARA